MTHSLPIGLLQKMGVDARVVLGHKIFDLLAQIAYHKNEFTDTSLLQLIDDDTQYGSACQRDQCLGLGVTMGSQLRAGSGNGNNGFHAVYKSNLTLPANQLIHIDHAKRYTALFVAGTRTGKTA